MSILPVSFYGTYDRKSLAIMVSKGSERMNINDAKAMVDMMRGAKNPQALLREYARTNQNVREVMDYMDKCSSPKEAFYQMASAKGIDPEAILSMIRR